MGELYKLCWVSDAHEGRSERHGKVMAPPATKLTLLPPASVSLVVLNKTGYVARALGRLTNPR